MTTDAATPPSGPPERRRASRHICGPEVACRLVAEPGTDFWARVQNISTGGLALVLDRMIPTGKVLTAELHHRGRGFSCRRQIRVIYTLQETTGELLAGAAFHPELTGQDLQQLVS